jgi:hypothetical protein
MDTNLTTWVGYERTLRAAKRSPKTIQSYEESLHLLAAFHGGADVTALDTADIEEFMIDQLRQHKATRVQVCGSAACGRSTTTWSGKRSSMPSPMARMTEPKPTDKTSGRAE